MNQVPENPEEKNRSSFLSVRFLTQAAIIAGVYAALTVALAPISYGPMQARVSEALTVLPFFTPAAIPGLFVGCLISNTVSFMGLPDVIFGSAATLVSALMTRWIARVVPRERVALRAALLPLPPVLVNALVIGVMLVFFADMPFAAAALGVGLGEFGSCYCIGLPLYFALDALERRKVFTLQ